MIKLYHYSNKNFKRFIDPEFFGLNSYSQNSARVSGVKRVYFYSDITARVEYRFLGSKYLYISAISKNDLYNIDSDILKLAGNGKDIYTEVKKQGYRGVISGNITVLFYLAKINRQVTLTKQKGRDYN